MKNKKVEEETVMDKDTMLASIFALSALPHYSVGTKRTSLAHTYTKRKGIRFSRAKVGWTRSAEKQRKQDHQ